MSIKLPHLSNYYENYLISVSSSFRLIRLKVMGRLLLHNICVYRATILQSMFKMKIKKVHPTPRSERKWWWKGWEDINRSDWSHATTGVTLPLNWIFLLPYQLHYTVSWVRFWYHTAVNSENDCNTTVENIRPPSRTESRNAGSANRCLKNYI